ncbi:unnamed protein product [Darwinula stevensoni]|uniref:CTLH domain-containing protein n=1 Tax=Darwinula stevensoni TaxID=69355 RepID=A0A7R8ZZY0_9CRUS|nr:unnamed protein product [Darwinula stevensoni]CAG0883506.1 unnamed protein product [Darwinula stevensoni]
MDIEFCKGNESIEIVRDYVHLLGRQSGDCGRQCSLTSGTADACDIWLVFVELLHCKMAVAIAGQEFTTKDAVCFQSSGFLTVGKKSSPAKLVMLTIFMNTCLCSGSPDKLEWFWGARVEMQQAHLEMQEQRTQGTHQNGVVVDCEEHKENVKKASMVNSQPSADESPNLTPVQYDAVRLVGQYLLELGLHRSVDLLMAESGCRLDHPAAAKFRQHVMNGEWAKAEADLIEISPFLKAPQDVTKMRFLLLEEKFLELAEEHRTVEALNCLRRELSPLGYNTERLHQLASWLMCGGGEELRQSASWSGRGQHSRSHLMEELQAFLPPAIMLPPQRLKTLLDQAIEFQCERCLYHNTSASVQSLPSFTLLTDHVCSKEQFPCETIQTLADHSDEVWFCLFSPDGRTLATGSKDTTIILWDVESESLTVRHKKTLDGHGYGVAYMAWSPDSRWLAACGSDESSEVWIWDAESGDLKVKVNQSPDDSLTCVAFHSCSTKFVTGGTKGQFYQCDIDGNIHDTWEGVRVRALWCKGDGKTVYAADTHHRIRGYILEDLRDFPVLQEDHAIMSLHVSSDCRLALVNVSNQGVHLWDLDNKALLRKFQGPTQSLYTIYSCFGGLNEAFVASGSEGA